MNILMLADTVRSPDLRHVVPVPIGDPFLYVETDDVRQAFIQAFEVDSLARVENLVVSSLEDVGYGKVVAETGSPRHALVTSLQRVCHDLGIEEAIVPTDFPMDAADYLRREGIELGADPDAFELRRRRKTAAEVAGLKYVLARAEHGIETVRAILAARKEVSSETLRAAVRSALSTDDLYFAYLFVSHGEQSAEYYEPGSGVMQKDNGIVVDFGIRDNKSGCWADVTRTFYYDEAPPEIVRYHSLCESALDLVYERLAPGITGAELFDDVCDFFEREGFETPRSAEGETLRVGFIHKLGHGIGLEIHEAPLLNSSGAALVSGDVIAIEPGLYQPGLGGCRLEDTVLITDDGYERLNAMPYDGRL